MLGRQARKGASSVEDICCSKELEFSAQYSYRAAHNSLGLQLQGLRHPLLGSAGPCTHMAYAHMHTWTIKNAERKVMMYYEKQKKGGGRGEAQKWGSEARLVANVGHGYCSLVIRILRC